MKLQNINFALADNALHTDALRFVAEVEAFAQTRGTVAAIQLQPLHAAAAKAVPLLTYAGLAHSSSDKLQQLAADCGCCVVFNVYADFPYLPALRRRAAEACGDDIALIEIAHSGNNSEAIAILMTHINRLMPATALLPINFNIAACAGLLGVKLAEDYRKLSGCLPPTLLPVPALDDIEALQAQLPRYVAAVRHAAGERMLMRFCLCVILWLADVKRKQGDLGAAFLSHIKTLTINNDSDVYPIKTLCELLFAEVLLRDNTAAAEALLAKCDSEIMNAPATRTGCLLHTIFLRIKILLLEVTRQSEAHKQCTNMLLDSIRQLNKEETEAAGVLSFVKVHRLRESIEDLL